MELDIVRIYSDGNEKDRAHVQKALGIVFGPIFARLAAKNGQAARTPLDREAANRTTKPGSHGNKVSAIRKEASR